MLKMAGGFKMMDVTKVELFRSKDWLDERAFEAIFQERYTKIYAVLFRLIGDRYEADDLTAETFWRLWEHPPARDENIGGWLYRVAMRLGYNALRDNQRREHYEENAARDAIHEALGDLTSDDPPQETEQRQEREFVRALLRQMPFRDVQVLVLRHSGLSYKEIAAVVDVSVSSVGTLLSRAESKFEALYRRGVKDAPKR